MSDNIVHSEVYFSEVQKIAGLIRGHDIEQIAARLAQLRDDGGRLFFLGVGGSAGNASHAVNDFRKLCQIESYAPTDNVSELTARVNDEGWDTAFVEWLRVSKLGPNDAVFVLSVGGGSATRNVSVNLVRALEFAKSVNCTILGIVGRDGGFTKQVGDNVIVVPVVHDDRVTPHSEAFQAVIWHCLVSHPVLQIKATKW